MSGLTGLFRRRRWRRIQARRVALADRSTSSVLTEWLATALPAPDTDFDALKLLAIDLELTGLDPTRDRILSIGWVPIDRGRIRIGGAVHKLVATDRGVGQSATIHGIMDADSSGGEPVETALEALLEALAERLPVVHHAPLDQACLDRALSEAFGAGFPAPLIDTLALERRQRERRQQTIGRGDLRLGALRDHYGLPATSMHNALVDALATAELLLAMCAGRGRTLADLV